jgi:hypothetical protein
MPKRLAKKEVIVDLGYPFEEEVRTPFASNERGSPNKDDFLIIRRALEKDQIDEIIKVSETYDEKIVKGEWNLSVQTSMSTNRYDRENDICIRWHQRAGSSATTSACINLRPLSTSQRSICSTPTTESTPRRSCSKHISTTT